MSDNFIQSEIWRKFQDSVGRKTFFISFPSHSTLLPKGEGEIQFQASIVEHQLPIAGRYFYIPRWPMTSHNSQLTTHNFFNEIVDLAKKENAGWVRVEPENQIMLELIQALIPELKIKKASHNMQPKEIFVMDIRKTEEELLAEMKEKTRYNIKLSQKRGVIVKKITNDQETRNKQGSNSNDQNFKNYTEEFLKLIKQTSVRKGIKSHPESYYQKMLEIIPQENLKLYLAEYSGKVIAGTLVIYFGKTATYLHGASSDEFRNVMAPHLLQWQGIQDAKKAGMEKYDFGGIKTHNSQLITHNSNGWAGITKFKLGFSPNTKPTEFPGSYDIIINPLKYVIYRTLQKIKSLI